MTLKVHRRSLVKTRELDRLRMIEAEFKRLHTGVRIHALRYHSAAAGNELAERARQTIGHCGSDLDSLLADVGSTTWRKGNA